MIQRGLDCQSLSDPHLLPLLIDLGILEPDEDPVCFKIPLLERSQYGRQVSTKATDEGSEVPCRQQHIVLVACLGPFSTVELQVRLVFVYKQPIIDFGRHPR